MKPINFKQANVVFAKDQKEYLPLPAYYEKEQGIVTSCWGFSFWERIKVLFIGRIYFSSWTFGGPLQPQRPEVDLPTWIPTKEEVIK